MFPIKLRNELSLSHGVEGMEKQWYSEPLFVQNSFEKRRIGFSLSCTQFLNKIWLTGPLFPLSPALCVEMGFYADIF